MKISKAPRQTINLIWPDSVPPFSSWVPDGAAGRLIVGLAGAANLEINLKEVKAEPNRILIIKKEIKILSKVVILNERSEVKDIIIFFAFVSE